MEKQKLLYVDDEELNLELFKYNLKGHFYVQTACSGQQALRLLDEDKSINFVISDMRMPGMNGLEFIKKAKNKFPDISYYILTGFSINAEIEKALESDLIQKYFNKPYEVDTLVSELN